MSVPRGLSHDEAQAWARLAATVTPFEGRKAPVLTKSQSAPVAKQAPLEAQVTPPGSKKASAAAPSRGLDSHWDRRLKAGSIQPELTLDLHGHNLDQAYDRLMGGMAQARAIGARVVLVIAGRPRPVDPADRAERRGAIRAKLLDWLAASSHHSAIAAIGKAHIRHGGEGALYVVLKREGQ